MKISIITICYNSALTIEKTIQSVIAQDYKNIEYIVIDGKSTDGTQEIINKYQTNISYFVSEPDQGIYDAMNKGIKMATGHVVGILNSDDMYANNHVLSQIASLFEKTNADSVYADLVYVERDNLDKIKRKWISGPYKPGAFKKGWMPPHPAFFVKKEIYNKYGAFNTTLRTSADYELMLRFIHRYHISTAYLPQVIIKMRQGGQSNASLKNRVKANREDRMAWKINGLSPGFLTLTRKPLRKIFQWFKR